MVESALVFLALIPGAAAAEPVAFGGSTTQDRPVVVRLAGDRAAVTRFTVVWQASCERRGRVAFTSDVADPPIGVSARRFRSRRLDVAEEGGEQVRIDHRVAGRIGSRGVAGVVRFTAAYIDASGAETDRCDSGRLRFRAGRSQIGETSQHEPVWIGARRLGFAWTATCASGEPFFVAEVADGVRVPRNGRRFSLRLVGRLDLGRREAVVTQLIRGQVGTRQGSGSWRAHVVVIRESSGRVVDQCDTGRLSWRVRS